MKKTVDRIPALIVAALLSVAGVAQGYPLDFSAVTWDTAGDQLGWTGDGLFGFGAVGVPGGGGNSGGYLDVTFDGTGMPGTRDDLLSVSSPVGDPWDFTQYQNLGLNFDFLNSPSAASVVMGSANGSRWIYGFTPSQIGWQSFALSLSDPTGWAHLSGGDDFATIRSQVQYMGVYVRAPLEGDPLTYGIDNWQYEGTQTPEPGTIASMGLLLAMGAFAWRRMSNREAEGSAAA